MTLQLSDRQKELRKSTENQGALLFLAAFIAIFRNDLCSTNVITRENAQKDLFTLRKTNAVGSPMFEALELITKLTPAQILDAIKPSNKYSEPKFLEN